MSGSGHGARTFVVGVGMTKFEKPGARDWDYPEMAREAGTKALEDAGIPYDSVEQAFVGYCYGESTSGQRSVYQLGLTGIPVVNVNNNCSTGSSALYMARQAVRGGLAECALALGFEKMEKGSLGGKWTDRTNPIEIAGQAMTTDLPSTFDEQSSIKIVGFDMTREAAKRAYEEAGVDADGVDVIELHDCFSANELITYEALGLAEEGHGHELVDEQGATHGGSGVGNPAGAPGANARPLWPAGPGALRRGTGRAS